MSDQFEEPRWDVFIAHAGVDTDAALQLYDVLKPHAKVFIDERDLNPGDPWNRILPDMLERSRIIVVMVSPATRGARYQDSEIRIALDLLRDFPDRYRIIPILLDEKAPITRTQIPYGLEGIKTLSYSRSGGVKGVARRILEILAMPNAQMEYGSGGDSSTPVRNYLLVDGATAFVGETALGPRWPLLITSWNEYRKYFGEARAAASPCMSLAVRGFFENGGELAYVARVLPIDAATALARIPTNDPAQTLLITARTPGIHGNRFAVHLLAGTRRGIRLAVREGSGGNATVVEAYDNLSPDPAGVNPLENNVNRVSECIQVSWSNPDAPHAEPMLGDWILAGGSDGYSSVEDYIGAAGAAGAQCGGLRALGTLEDIAMVCIPQLSDARFTEAERQRIGKALLEDCERHHRLALLSLPMPADMSDMPIAPFDNSYGAAYLPWITVLGPNGGSGIAVPPVGHIAGALVQHDKLYGVHVSPKGLKIHGLLAPPSSAPVMAAAEQSLAYTCAAHGINILLPDPKQPDRVIAASAVTMATDYTWTSIGIRRLTCYVERGIAARTAWKTLAPSNEASWSRLVKDVSIFLTELWEAGALSGNTPEEAFFVRCDQGTMTAEDIANGRINAVMGFAPVRSELERFITTTGGDGDKEFVLIQLPQSS